MNSILEAARVVVEDDGSEGIVGLYHKISILRDFVKNEGIPESPNEMGPGNPVTSFDVHTVEGVTLRWNFDEPIQQSRMMAAIGRMAGMLGVMPTFDLPPPGTQCFTCGGPVERAFLVNAGIPGAISHDDCWDGFWCPKCQEFWSEVMAAQRALCQEHPATES